MALVVFIILLLTIIYFEKRIYNTYYTPSIILAVPFFIIYLIYNFYSESFGFKKLDHDVVYIWFFGLLIFWISGVVVTFFIPYRVNYKINFDLKKKVLNTTSLFLNFSFAVSIIMTYYLYQAFILYNSSGGEAVENYLGTGIQAHLTIILKLLSIVSSVAIFGSGNLLYKAKHFYVILVCLGLAVLYATKSGLLILFISYFLANVFYFKKKIKLLHVVIALVTGFLIFFLTYSLVFGEWADIEFIWKHMILYYVCGVASMNAYFTHDYIAGIDPEFLFQSYFNIFYVFTGNEDNVRTIISDEWTNIGNGVTINVKTFFGTIYLYGGLGYGILAIFIFSSITYIIFKLSLMKNNFFFVILYSYLLAMLCFGWFDFYFNNIATIETIVICLFLNFLYKAKLNNGTKNT